MKGNNQELLVKMNKWKTYKLGEIVDVLGDGIHGTPIYNEVGDYYFINGNNLGEGYIKIKENTLKVDEKEYLKHKKNLTNRTLLLSINGTLGNVAKYRGEPCILGKSACYLNISKSHEKDFIYYIIASANFRRDLENMATGTTIKNVSLKALRNYEISLPPLETQKRIADILSAIDDKIELNRRINANLEQQAQAIYKSWFVDFEPWGGCMPRDWREGTLGEICTCYLGGTPSRAKSEYWGGQISWINSGEVNKFRIIAGTEFITELGLKKSATKLLPKKTTVLAITGATLGQVSLLEIDSCANQSVIGILENESIPYEFIYPLIQNDIERIIRNQTGGAQQHINKNNIESHNVKIPDIETMTGYKAIQTPIYNEIANRCFENQYLTQLRDTLLPKLMSGEIDV